MWLLWAHRRRFDGKRPRSGAPVQYEALSEAGPVWVQRTAKAWIAGASNTENEQIHPFSVNTLDTNEPRRVMKAQKRAMLGLSTPIGGSKCVLFCQEC